MVAPLKLSVAPMMAWTDRHCRYFHRLLSPDAVLYTEMVTSQALYHGDRARFLKYNPEEHPLVLQLGGSCPEQLAFCARRAEDAGFDEINLNVGCPSDRVQQGKIGACLMAEPELVAECVASMKREVRIPVTVKTRIGIDHQDSEAFLHQFIRTVAAAGCDHFLIHARKAWLSGLSPKENRTIPPLCYERVQGVKVAFPHLRLTVNGGIQTVAQAEDLLTWADGVMIGREAYHRPFFLAELSQHFFARSLPEREAVLRAYVEYAEHAHREGVPLSALARPIHGLFKGQPGGRAYRQFLSENTHRPDTQPAMLWEAYEQMQNRAVFVSNVV